MCSKATGRVIVGHKKLNTIVSTRLTDLPVVTILQQFKQSKKISYTVPGFKPVIEPFSEV